MARQHPTRSSVVRRLLLSPERLAAAAALQDPNLLLQLQAARSHDERPATAPRSSTPLQRRSGVPGVVLTVGTWRSRPTRRSRRAR
jgi:hypothetical protein